MSELGNYSKNKKNPRGNQSGVGRTNESIRMAYLLLWNFALRVLNGNPESLSTGANIFNDPFQDLLFSFKNIWADNIKKQEPNYRKLMIDLTDELNIFINGVKFPGVSIDSNNLHLKDPDYLDAVANSLGDLDGIVGFILSGNDCCSTELLKDLTEFNYESYLDKDSTSDRAKKVLSLRS